jgi:hypothetical protein
MNVDHLADLSDGVGKDARQGTQPSECAEVFGLLATRLVQADACVAVLVVAERLLDLHPRGKIETMEAAGRSILLSEVTNSHGSSTSLRYFFAFEEALWLVPRFWEGFLGVSQ